MFANQGSPALAYARVGMETGVQAADPHKLILMLFEGALLAISRARLHLQRKEIAEKGRAVSHAIEIIGNGLKASLDMEVGGDLAGKLGALYDYMCLRLLTANLENDDAAFAEVSRLLAEIKGAWEEIAGNPAVHPANQAAA